MFLRQVDERSHPIDDRRRPRVPLGRAAIAATLVFVVAAVLRLPSCFESFWLDELHSAWSVWGTLGDVMPRAAAGNQTPIYFWGLWLWKQVAGESEVLLRLPSVLASSLAAALVTYGIARHRGDLMAAIIGGLVLAAEANSLFYGTELRPFAFAMLFGAVACYVVTSDSMKHGRKLLWLVLILTISGLFQPTSIGVLGWLVAAQCLWMKWHRSDSLVAAYKIRWYGWAALAISLPAFVWLSGGVLIEAWSHRQQWQTMGQADSLRQLAEIWPWGTLVVIPACLAWGGRLWFTRFENGSQALPWWCLASVAMIATLTFWAFSATGMAPVFHRRYFIACLPILAWVTGDALSNRLTFKMSERIALMVLAIAFLPLVTLLIDQGTAKKGFTPTTPLVRRGEGWREAVAWLNLHTPPETVVYLNPGLIESTRLLDQEHEDGAAYAQWYLTNPLKGPYRRSKVIAFDRRAKPRPALPIVIRGTRATAESWLRHLNDGKLHENQVIRSFGSVQLIENGPPELPAAQY